MELYPPLGASNKPLVHNRQPVSPADRGIYWLSPKSQSVNNTQVVYVRTQWKAILRKKSGDRE
ncbi:MAG: hypothetical protein CMJ65_04535 [Planctomycetaceae bacterium]|nr:hypothetical protein [Planctomycetaceae bacterium]